MSEEITREELVQRWRGYLQGAPATELGRVLDMYPAERALELAYYDIEREDTVLADQLLHRPQTALYCAELAINAITAEDYRRPKGHVKIQLRVNRLPRTTETRVPVRSIRTKHSGRLIGVEGLVRFASGVRPIVEEGMFKCARCHAVLSERQSGQNLKEPSECYKDQAGCGRAAMSTKFLLLEERSEVMDFQRVELQEIPEDLAPEQQPQRLTCWLAGDLAGRVVAGQRIILNGILRAELQEKRPAKRVLQYRLDVVSYESSGIGGEPTIDREDEKAIKELAADPRVVDRIAKSIAPSLYGLKTEKLAVALQLFGGSAKATPEGTRLRGDIHILLLGDPSTGKSQLLNAARAVHYKSVIATGRGVSGAGLTAAIRKDDVTGEMTLEAGVLPMANDGLACIDEIDKMNEEDRARMHPAMEQQTVEITKAGIHATMVSRTSILAAANPKQGAWRDDKLLADQIEMPSSLMSRFDAVFVIRDIPDGGQADRALVEHVLLVHESGAAAENAGRLVGEVPSALEAEVDPDLLRKYVYYARTRVKTPLLTAEAHRKISEYYLKLRESMSNAEDRQCSISVRQLEGLIRFAEASARARLSERVDEEDVLRAVGILEHWAQALCAPSSDRWNLNVLYGGYSQSIKDDMDRITQVIRELDAGAGAEKTAVITSMEARHGMKRDRVIYLIEKLYTEGTIFERDDDRFRVA